MVTDTSQPSWRWLIDPPMDGPTNMARDEAILRAVGQGDAPPTLRFYRWDPPTISLGYFQSFADYADLAPPAGNLAVVRRQTGGGAILHDRELTYSLTLPLGHTLLGDGRARTLYDHVHAAFADLLQREGLLVDPGPTDSGSSSHRGPFFCFERHSSFDLLARGQKIMGSAQRRTVRAVLQHGSLVLDRRFDQQICAAVSDFAAFDIDAHLPELAAAIAGLGVGRPGTLTSAEMDMAEQLRAKYADPAWTRRR